MYICTYVRYVCVICLGLEELLNIRTSRRFIAGRLTSDMETKLNFLTSKVFLIVIYICMYTYIYLNSNMIQLHGQIKAPCCGITWMYHG